ncbi:MAG TPA: ISNCY family transposase [Isosphaeraceae bacterium]|nr:ISNCY family transposase [Isosphaeraceae bacterium]
MWAAYTNRRTVVTLDGPIRLTVQVRRCRDRDCPRCGRSVRPEAEGRVVLPRHEFGLDVIALIGSLRYTQHRSVPEIHAELVRRSVDLCPRTVTNLLDRYDELLALSLADDQRLQRITAAEGRVILAIDGLQPDVGHEVLWVLRDCLSGEVLLAKSLLSSTQDDLAALIGPVKDALKVPITGVVSDGQDSIRKAVKKALPDVPHQLCQFHYLREAARPVYESDRHAKKVLKKRVRGVRPIERKVEGRDDPDAQAVRGYCAAVRRALTDDGRPPLAASGLVLKGRLEQVVASLDRVEGKKGLPPELTRLRSILQTGLVATTALWTPVAAAYDWVFRAAAILANVAGNSGAAVQASYRGLLGAMARHGAGVGNLAGALEHFRKVTRSYWPGLFHCYDVADLPRTNNDLEQLFGSHRYHERRCSGRKVASPGLVVRGSVRLPAALATRLGGEIRGEDLAPADLEAWRDLRASLERRQKVRTQGRRFRHDPAAYLQELEDILVKGILPP